MKPDFIAIGPEKTGTSWLHNVISDHPGIWMPPPKEIRYFFEKFYMPNYSTYQRLISDHWHFGWKGYLKNRRGFYLSSNLMRPKKFFFNLIWDIKFVLGKRDDEWYKSLFPEEYISGDISPAYGYFNSGEVQKVFELCPHSKIIISLRDPVERLWSLAKMVLLKHKSLEFESVEKSEFLEYFTKNINERPSYFDIYKNWTGLYGKDKVYISYYDDLKNDPANYVKGVLNFLGLDEKKLDTKHPLLNKEINKGLEVDLPSEFRDFIWSKLRNDIIRLNKELERDEVESWIRKYEK